MHGIKIWVEEHPYLFGSAILALIVVYLLYRNGGSSGSQTVAAAGGPSEGLQAAQLAAGVQVQLGQLAVQNTIVTKNAEVNEVQILSAADVVKTGMARDVALQQIISQADVANYLTDAELTLGLAQVGYQTRALEYQTPTVQYIYGQAQASTTLPAPTTAPSVTQPGVPAQLAPGNYQGYDPTLDYSNYQGWLPAPGTNGRPSYGELQASGQITVCDQNSVGGQYACFQKNEEVLHFYGLG